MMRSRSTNFCIGRVNHKRWHQTTNSRPSSLSSSKGNALVPHSTLKAFSIGSIAGILGSLAGMGGGFIMIPLMTSNLKLCQHVAHGTSLFAVTTTGIAGTLGLHDQVNGEAAFIVATCGMMTARMGARATAHLSSRFLQKCLGIFMLAMAPMVPLKAYIMKQQYETKTEEKRSNEMTQQAEKKKQEFSSSTANHNVPIDDRVLLQRALPPACIGLGSGFLAGLFGVGGGVIVVPMLAITMGDYMTHYQALATSLCAMTFPAAVGTWTHFRAGNVALPRIAPALALGSFVGALCGSRLGVLNLPEDTLRWGFSGLMVTLGLKTLFKL